MNFKEFEVVDFRITDIRQFVTKWYNSSQDPHKKMKITDLSARLQQNMRIQALATNPLLLLLIV
jgi:intein-encoded DNA endonuclease-like protein